MGHTRAKLQTAVAIYSAAVPAAVMGKGVIQQPSPPYQSDHQCDAILIQGRQQEMRDFTLQLLTGISETTIILDKS